MSGIKMQASGAESVTLPHATIRVQHPFTDLGYPFTEIYGMGTGGGLRSYASYSIDDVLAGLPAREVFHLGTRDGLDDNQIGGWKFDHEKITGGGERMVAPFIKLTVGDLYKKCPGYLKSFNVDYDMDATWEINTGERLPKKISVTCDFIYIGEEQFKSDGNNYGFDAEKFNQNKL